ncbi:hypothetical protein [Erythrobacter sp. SD-21]|uniref:hypothetical protein n=1 Tax=Erythrobacter sp. SD-21 TaxID=161528 RepID=UPI000153FE1D|nr:hypothetical protein [Erythrobacter sp. SD-21]EDL49754.1 hypothetical protein ED21_19187 [Erythrobacter sp. SD-21]
MRKIAVLLTFAAGLSGCMSAPKTYSPTRQLPVTTTRPPPQQPVQPAPSGGRFIAPKVMNVAGLEGVIGRDATALANIFGPPRLEVKEGDAMKLQFSGSPCVLDIYLYPLRPGAEPSATHVEARRASDGEDVDRAACVRALRR